MPADTSATRADDTAWAIVSRDGRVILVGHSKPPGFILEPGQRIARVRITEITQEYNDA